MKFIVGIVSLFAASAFSSAVGNSGSSSRYYSRSVSTNGSGLGYSPYSSPFYRGYGAFGPYGADPTRDPLATGTPSAFHY